MRPRLSLVNALAMLVAAGCGGEGTLAAPDNGSAGIDEAPYQAWSTHDANGALADSGMRMQAARRDGRVLLSRETPSIGVTSRQLHPALEAALETAPEEEPLQVVLSVRSAYKLSRLPRFDARSERDGPYNLEVLDQRRLIQAADGDLRALERQPVAEAIERLGGSVTEQFRVGNAIAASLSANALRTLLDAHPEIIAASPALSEEAPATAYDIDDGRADQKSDQMVQAGYDAAGYRVGLLDTGVYASHNVFTNPDPVYIFRDCVYTIYESCNFYNVYPYNLYYNASDPVADGGHGTAMADIIAGNSNLGNAWRGVAPGAILDSTNVYGALDHSALSQTAVLRAFNLLSTYDDVIVANVAAGESESGTIALAADDLYDLGVIVVAPVGNVAGQTAFSPAIAHKVLGIGAYYAGTGYDYSPQSGGTNGGGRFKPDVTAPTKIWAASNAGSSSLVERRGTCPAAAFAGGAAVLLRDYYDYRLWSQDPGAIYAAMITFGDEGGSDLDNNDGAGNLKLGAVANSSWYSGVMYLNPGDSQDIYFYVGPNTCELRSGIWWAESYPDDHATIYLSLYQGLIEKTYSGAHYSVFQKVMHPATMGTGWWHIHLYSVSLNTQYNVKVHYLIHMRTDCI